MKQRIFLMKHDRHLLNKSNFFIIIAFSVFATMPLMSCEQKRDSDTGYSVCYLDDKIILKNNKGSISFPASGKISISGNCLNGELMPGSSLTMVSEDDNKRQVVVFEHKLEDKSIHISTSSNYKKDCMIEYDGIIGDCEGEIGLERDKNVFVNGTPILVGYLDSEKKQFAICPEHGQLTPFYSRMENKYYTLKTIKSGECLSTEMIIFNDDEKPIRLLCQPDGRCATFTVAAHADRAKSLVTRAILYGTSDTTSNDYGKKGMLSNGIVGTLSVFVKHTEQWREAEAIEVSYFKELIDKAYLQGMEICPHTISYHPDDRESFLNYLPMMEENYHCRNWIDHMLREGIESSGLHSLGGDSTSAFYVMDILRKYGYQYCWAYIDSPGDDGKPRDQFFDGHFMFPRHLVYQNDYLEGMYQYKNAWEQLEKLVVKKDNDPIQFMEEIVDNCGVWTDHCYLIGEWGKLYEKDDKKREYRISPKLESFFEYIKERKNKGDVWNPTMSEFCDYMVRLENISICRLKRGVYQITNRCDEPVNCSFYYKGNGKVFLNGVPMHSKETKYGKVFWGNLEATNIMNGGGIIC